MSFKIEVLYRRQGWPHHRWDIDEVIDDLPSRKNAEDEVATLKADALADADDDVEAIRVFVYETTTVELMDLRKEFRRMTSEHRHVAT